MSCTITVECKLYAKTTEKFQANYAFYSHALRNNIFLWLVLKRGCTNCQHCRLQSWRTFFFSICEHHWLQFWREKINVKNITLDLVSLKMCQKSEKLLSLRLQKLSDLDITFTQLIITYFQACMILAPIATPDLNSES